MSEYVLRRDTRPFPETAADLKQWFPKCEERPETQLQALGMILCWAQREFGQDISMQASPTMFGCQLLQRSLPEGYEYPAILDGWSRLLHAISFPHRMEKFGDTKDAVCLDGRLMFLACATQMPCYFPVPENQPQLMQVDDREEFAAYRQGWYQCDITVPADWKHIGLVPMQYKKLDKTYTAWPYRPGLEFQSWLHESAVRRLREYEWPHMIRKRLLFAPQGPGTRPLRFWQERFCAAIEKIGDKPTDPVLRLARAGLRDAALHTLGRFHHNGIGKTSWIRNEEGELEEQTIYPRFDAYTARWHHPEWSAAIWNMAQDKAIRLALQAPRAAIREIRGDAVYFDPAHVPDVPDSGRVGAFRRK